MADAESSKSQDVPSQVFAMFVEALPKKAIDAEVAARLQKCLLEDRTFTEKAIKAAIFPEEAIL